MNGLVDAIKVVDPDYQPPLSVGEKNRIYMFQYPAYMLAAEMETTSLFFFVGQTDPARGWKVEGEYLVRWEDNDYSKCPEKPKTFTYIDIHPDILDSDILSTHASIVG